MPWRIPHLNLTEEGENHSETMFEEIAKSGFFAGGGALNTNC